MAARGPGVGNVIVALSLVYVPRTALLGVTLTIAGLSLNLLGDGLRDTLDPGSASGSGARPRRRGPAHAATRRRRARRSFHRIHAANPNAVASSLASLARVRGGRRLMN